MRVVNTALTIYALCLLIFCLSPDFANSAEQTAIATVSVSPPEIDSAVGLSFDINVSISDVIDLYGWEFRLSWNSTLLDVTNVVEGSFLATGGSTYFSYKANATTGRMIADCTLLGPVSGVDGNGELATVVFYVKNTGECPLNLYDVILVDSSEPPQHIANQVVDGYGNFSGLHDIAVVSVDSFPTIVLAGTQVDIDVDVQNQGGSNETFNVTVKANSETIDIQSISLDIGSSSTLHFHWDTTGFEKGEYSVSALASIIDGEVDIIDNSRNGTDVVTILFSGHDIAVESVAPYKTVVGQNFTIPIDVLVKNFGTYTETFNTTIYANATAIDTKSATLASGNSAVIIFFWNTTGFVRGCYVIKAYAWPVSGEVNLSDNTLIFGLVKVVETGDINADGSVGLQDLVILANAYGAQQGDMRWNPNADLNGNEVVDLLDLVLLARNYGL